MAIDVCKSTAKSQSIILDCHKSWSASWSSIHFQIHPLQAGNSFKSPSRQKKHRYGVDIKILVNIYKISWKCVLGYVLLSRGILHWWYIVNIIQYTKVRDPDPMVADDSNRPWEQTSVTWLLERLVNRHEQTSQVFPAFVGERVPSPFLVISLNFGHKLYVSVLICSS